MSYVIRNYGPTRELPFKNQHITMVRDQAIVTNDLEMVQALSGQPMINVSKQPGTVPPASAPAPAPIAEPIEEELDYNKMKKRELLELAEERSIKMPEKITKKELIELLSTPSEKEDEDENEEIN